LTVPSNEFARVVDETTITEFPGIYDNPEDTVSESCPLVIGVIITGFVVAVLKIFPDRPVGPCGPVGP
jgi:hypothetical protein